LAASRSRRHPHRPFAGFTIADFGIPASAISKRLSSFGRSRGRILPSWREESCPREGDAPGRDAVSWRRNPWKALELSGFVLLRYDLPHDLHVIALGRLRHWTRKVTT